MKKHVAVACAGVTLCCAAVWVYVPIRWGGRIGPEVSQATIDQRRRSRYAGRSEWARQNLEPRHLERLDREYGALFQRRWVTDEPWWPPRFGWFWASPPPGSFRRVIGINLTTTNRVNLRAFALINLPIAVLLSGGLLTWVVRRERRKRAAA